MLDGSGNVEDGDIASQSSTLELTGVSRQALRILCALESIVRRASWLTVLFCGSSGRVERRQHTECINRSQAPPCGLANRVLKYQ